MILKKILIFCVTEQAARELGKFFTKTLTKINLERGAEVITTVFLGRSVRSMLPNSVDPTLNSKDLINRRINRHEHRMTNTNKNKNNVIYQPGTQVMIQNVRMKDFLLNGTVESQRMSDDGQVLSSAT